jgi:hypothetical protein
MCKNKDQQCVAIEELVCDKSRIAMICSCTLIFANPKKLKNSNYGFSYMKIKFMIKRIVDGTLGFCFMQVHFAFESSSINEGKR